MKIAVFGDIHGNIDALSAAYHEAALKKVDAMYEGKRVKLFHAAPHKNNIYWYEDRPEKFFLEMAGKADADILVFGHTHKS
jgi:predicted phosphodiesterase